jgi:hypothetical protein
MAIFFIVDGVTTGGRTTVGVTIVGVLGVTTVFITKLSGKTLFTTKLNIPHSPVASNVARLYAKHPNCSPVVPTGTYIFSFMVWG